MKNIPLSVLDEYAKRLTPNQVNKLYEAKNHKSYNKAIFENVDDRLNIYVNAYTIAQETKMNKTEFAMWLNENYSELMNNISYKIEKDAIIFNAYNHEDRAKLSEALSNAGFSGNTVLKLIMENMKK